MTDPKELRALLAKVPDGPWVKNGVFVEHAKGDICRALGNMAPDRAAFIAAARSAVPALLDRVEALEAALKPFADLADYYQIGGPLRAVSGPIISVEDHRIGERTITVEHLFAAASLLTPSDRSAEQ